ncbi:uncharacterized protein LOC134183923 [Corticium candelabrum]|uniref:uncharacterized protein LOC134183923 n=1 Tax=Corticium candelabrum TaxID=121492 RepID=UPI002E312F9F|nr:uncharacterized protein LOC134183923 [Corticium candelabrum]
MARRCSGHNNVGNSIGAKKEVVRASRYKLLKDKPLSDYITRHAWQQEAQQNDENRRAALGSFDVENYCRRGDTVRIGVNGRVRQPSRNGVSEQWYEYWEEMDPLMMYDKYNQLLWKINEKNGTLNVKRKSEVYSWTDHVPVPLCWEDQLSDSMVTTVDTSIRTKTEQQTHTEWQKEDEHWRYNGEQKAVDCLKNQHDAAIAVSSIDVNISCKQSKLLFITLQSHFGSELKPALDTWSFDVHVVDKTDSRQSTRVFSSVKPQLHNSMYMYSLQFDISRDLQWITSINQLYGREFHVTVTVSYPWTFHLCSQIIQIGDEAVATNHIYMDENKSIHSDDDDEDVMSVSSLPTMLLSGFEVRNETEKETLPYLVQGSDCSLQGDCPMPSGHKNSFVFGEKQARDIQSLLTTEDIMPVMEKRTSTGTSSLLVARSKNCGKYSSSRSPTQCIGTMFPMQQTSKHQLLDANGSVVVPKFVEKQRKSFLRAQYVFTTPKLTSRIKTQTDKPPDVKRVRQLIEPVGDNKETRLKGNSSRVEGDKHRIHSNTQITHTLSHSMVSHLQRPHRDSTTLSRTKSAPILPTQPVVSLTGLCPTTTYKTSRVETTGSSRNHMFDQETLHCLSSHLYIQPVRAK